MTIEVKQSVSITFGLAVEAREIKEFLDHVPDDARIHCSFYDAGNDPRERSQITLKAEWLVAKKREKP